MLFSAVRRIAATLFIFTAVLVANAAAQDADLGKAPAGVVSDQQEVIASITARTDALQKKMEQSAEDDAGLVDIRLQLEQLSRDLLQSGVAFRPRLAEINARLEQLGKPPAEGQPPEPAVVTSEREKLNAEKTEINAVLGVAENLSIRIDRLISQITEIRRSLFQNLLTKRYQINFALGSEVADAFKTEMNDLYRTVSSWVRFVVSFKLKSMLAATFFALGAAAVIIIGGRRMFGRMFEPDGRVEEPSYLSRLSVAFWSTFMQSTALVVFLGVTYYLFAYFEVLRGDIGAMLWSLFYVIAIVFFVSRLGMAVLSPKLPKWRLIPVESGAARWLMLLITATAFFTGLDYFLSSVYQVLGSPVALTVGEALTSTVVIGVLVILIGLVKPFVDEEGHPKPWPRLFRYIVLTLGGVTIVAALGGYIGLARFVSQQIVITGTILATMYIGFLSSQAVNEEDAFVKTTVGRRIKRMFTLDDTTLDQLGLVSSMVINLLVLIVGVPLILFTWGFQPGDMITWLYRIGSGFQIGSFNFSPAGLLSGVMVFAIGYFVTRWFQGWLDGSVMARSKVDAGVRNSIRLAVGYAGVALAGLIAVSAAGIDLSNLALVAGALSLGIGFGLQNVVSNFVSGLILLAERPFKVGDWIVAGAVSGTVKKISVRATEIETFQRQSVILPNSDLINSAVGNWTHRNKLGRVEVPIGVAYGSDAKRVHQILLDIARGHPLVLKNPEPFVLFSAFADSSMNFEIRVFLADIGNSAFVQNDLRFAILEAFEREHIDIPFPQRSIRVVGDKQATPWPADDEQAEAEYAAMEQERLKKSGEETAKPKSRRRKPDPS
ncbi:mechanosensitive ion channel family protein [Aminobacter sp. NyZ550]|uniref:mechanosensitive ion channel family protein n=1 Tax=Aminobacter sp. NyZ550 TaxID=2979870 RepID=UPI0021D5A8DF|nr:mechanosensitive ion channel family protein [Aminobacter sp. NyZ550]WAX92851.1 mechanosensitive ion channel family protein [Aminobacter sp. NyZ550]